MTEIEVFEYYGFKAERMGLFQEWQQATSSLRQQNKDLNMEEVAEQAYKQIIGSNG